MRYNDQHRGSRSGPTPVLYITVDKAYAVLNYLRSILKFPQRHEAHAKPLVPTNESLVDYLFRSGFPTDIELEAQGIKTYCVSRVLNEALSGTDYGEVDSTFDYGKLARNSGIGDEVSITWRRDEGVD